MELPSASVEPLADAIKVSSPYTGSGLNDTVGAVGGVFTRIVTVSEPVNPVESVIFTEIVCRPASSVLVEN